MAVAGLNRRNHLDPEAGCSSQRFEDPDVAGALSAEAVVVADEQLFHPERASQHQLHELLRRVAGERAIERDQGDIFDAGFREDFKLFIPTGKEQRRSRGIHHFHRMRIEGDEHAGDAKLGRARYEALDHLPVSAMHPVECPDGYDGLPNVGWKRGAVAGLSHRPRL